MAEGDVHRRLVRLLSEQIAGEARVSWATFIDGVAPEERDGLPPFIEAYRPDVYAVERGSRRIVIGEAKTAFDIDNDHTKRQLGAYFRHVAEGSEGEVWMAVPMMSAGTAHRVCRVVRQQLGFNNIRFVITGWLIGPRSICEMWHA